MPNQPPLRARLHWYQLSASEFALLTAMCEHCSDGSTIWASIARLAAYSKLSERNVQRLVRGLCGRGILTQLAPSSGKKRRPTTYRINEAVLRDDPRMAPYRAYQQQLPGIRRPPVPGEPIPDATPVTPRHRSGDILSPQPVTPCHPSGDTMSPDSKAFDPKTINSNAEIRQRASLWAEKNSFAWRAFSRELDAIYGAAIGAHNFNHEAAVIKAARKAGVPDHIALALEHCGES